MAGADALSRADPGWLAALITRRVSLVGRAGTGTGRDQDRRRARAVRRVTRTAEMALHATLARQSRDTDSKIRGPL